MNLAPTVVPVPSLIVVFGESDFGFSCDVANTFHQGEPCRIVATAYSFQNEIDVHRMFCTTFRRNQQILKSQGATFIYGVDMMHLPAQLVEMILRHEGAPIHFYFPFIRAPFMNYTETVECFREAVSVICSIFPTENTRAWSQMTFTFLVLDSQAQTFRLKERINDILTNSSFDKRTDALCRNNLQFEYIPFEEWTFPHYIPYEEGGRQWFDRETLGSAGFYRFSYMNTAGALYYDENGRFVDEVVEKKAGIKKNRKKNVKKKQKRVPTTGKQFFSAGEKRRNPVVVPVYPVVHQDIVTEDDFKDNGRKIAVATGHSHKNNSRHVGGKSEKRKSKKFREDDYGGRLYEHPDYNGDEDEYIIYAYEYDHPSDDEYEYDNPRWR